MLYLKLNDIIYDIIKQHITINAKTQANISKYS